MSSNEIYKWLSEIKDTTENFKSTFGKLNVQQLNWKPDTNTWSIAQNVDHIITINESYFSVIDQLKAGTYKLPFTARFKFLRNFFAKIILDSVSPERKRKMKTFPVWEPSSGEISGDIIQRFEEHQNRLSNAITESESLLKDGIVISSPANKYIVYTLSDAFEIITTHEKRHYNQALEVFRKLG